MSAQLHVIRANEFVCLDANEHLDFEASKDALQGLAAACLKRGIDSALLDLRGLPILSKPHFTTEEVAGLVGAFRTAGFSRKQRLAILYEHDIYGIIRNFTFFSRMRGLQVQEFLDYEKSMHWLSGDKEHSVELKHGVEIPIAKRSVKKTRRSMTPGVSRAGTRPHRRTSKRK